MGSRDVGPVAEGGHDGQAPLTGGYFWLPTPGDATLAWDVVICHDLGFDAEVGHVEMWTALIDRLAVAWDKDAAVLRRTLKDCCYGLPRGRITRPRSRFLVLHGDDSPCSDWLERVLVAFHLELRSLRVVFDEHERTLEEDRKRVSKTLGVALSQIGSGNAETRD